MKIRLVVALAGLAMSFALPAFAQQKNTVDPKIEQQIRTLAAKYDEAINKQDAAPPLRRSTRKTGLGKSLSRKCPQATGRQGIEKAYARWFKGWQVTNYFTTVDRVTPAGNEIRSFGKWSDTFKGTEGGTQGFEGHYAWFLVREGDTWKIRRSTCSGYDTQ